MQNSRALVVATLLALTLQGPRSAFAQQQIAPSLPPPSAIASPTLAPAATSITNVTPPRQGASATSRLRQSVVTGEPPTAPALAAPCPAALAVQCTAAQAAELAYAKRYYEAQAQELELRRQAFEWHAFSTKVLFCCVIALTVMGLVLSWREFGKYYGTKRAAPTDAVPTTATSASPPPSVFKVSAQGLEVTSSLIGFLVLSVSLAFFYLYVVNVYPLHELANTQDAAPSQGETASAQP